ncbi:hypothetical protein LTR20_006551 [Exophiala xenobiotica]|nr:hypothetical protein LTR40_006419 [Exophiala xenobiotica]KAK5366390.1 hypothetical protein LTS13_008151 [Exophiala xenobiotica]KAK5395007.1 hypothetical protein LTR79_007623 [Exophiala xenobiotica]KAK5412993.1 hypothetical protein LTR90_007115 [Exophiala xenobiotica]KAK5461627.1 hypothetical protein LTR20_006551 [Exophiala xenobiotica]
MTPTTSGGSSSVRSSISSLQYVSSPSSGSVVSTSSTSYSYSIIVISSTTITLTRPGSTGSITGGAGTTLTIITATPTVTTTSSSSLGSYITTVVSNTIDGCGTASGSGIAAGTGTIYTNGLSIVTSGTASVSSVVGCGYIIATTGTFIGSAVITGCGYGSGSGTLTGTGTIWPAAGYGMMSIVSSGIVSGSGSFRGCGTLTGSGVFTATAGYTTTILAPATTTSFAGGRATKTVSVFVSYCATDLPGNAGGGSEGDVINNIFGNNNTVISPVLAGANGTNGADGGGGGEINGNQTMSVHGSLDNALCNTCPNSVGICCPPTVECEDDDDGGKCPVAALEMSGNTINGYLIAQVMNSTAPVEGKRRVRGRARVRVKTREEKELEKERDSRGLREEVQRRAGSGHGHGNGNAHGGRGGHGDGGHKKKKGGMKGTRRVHRKQF